MALITFRVGRSQKEYTTDKSNGPFLASLEGEELVDAIRSGLEDGSISLVKEKERPLDPFLVPFHFKGKGFYTLKRKYSVDHKKMTEDEFASYGYGDYPWNYHIADPIVVKADSKRKAQNKFKKMYPEERMIFNVHSPVGWLTIKGFPTREEAEKDIFEENSCELNVEAKAADERDW